MTKDKQWDRINHTDLHLDGDYNMLFETCHDITIEQAEHFNEIEEEEALNFSWEGCVDYRHQVTR